MGRRPAIGPLNQPPPTPGWSRVVTAVREARKLKEAGLKRKWEETIRVPIPYFSRGPTSVTFSEIETQVLETEPRYIQGLDGKLDSEKRRRARAKATTHSCLKKLLRQNVVIGGPEGYRLAEGVTVPSFLLGRTQTLNQLVYRIVAPRGAPIWTKAGDIGLPLLELEKLQAKDILVDWFNETLEGLESMKVAGYTPVLFHHVRRPRIYQWDRGAILARRPERDPDSLTDDDWEVMVKEPRPPPKQESQPERGEPPLSHSRPTQIPTRPRVASGPPRRRKPARGVLRQT